MKSRPKISVIVPIYNTEKYLEKCLDSIIEQSMDAIEIICIDDCSPDNSSEIVERYQKKDPRISLIRHKENLGLGGARNTAISAAKADYVASVDSDDYMLPNMLERLWEEAENGKFDVVCCGYNHVNEKGEIISTYKVKEQELKNTNNEVDIFSLTPSFCNKLWRKSLFTRNNLTFPIRMYYEDMVLTPCVISKAKHIKIISDPLFQYFIRSGSTMNSFTEKHILDYFKGFDIIRQYLEDNRLLNHYQQEFEHYVRKHLLLHSKNMLSSDMSVEDKRRYLQHLVMYRDGYLDNYQMVKDQNIDTLLSMFTLSGDLSRPQTVSGSAPLEPSQRVKLYEKEIKLLKQELYKKINFSQKIGVSLFGAITAFSLSDSLKVKLKTNPRGFFEDSKSGFARKYASLLKLNDPVFDYLTEIKQETYVKEDEEPGANSVKKELASKEVFHALYDLALINQEKIRSEINEAPWDAVKSLKEIDYCRNQQNLEEFSHVRGALKNIKINSTNGAEWGEGDAFLTWGNSFRTTFTDKSMDVVNAMLNEYKPLFIAEDGFLRSVASFEKKGVSDNYKISYSIVIDDLAPYYSAYQNTRLEQMLNNFDKASMDPGHVNTTINKILSSYLSKYNNQPLLDLEKEVKGGILVIDQVHNDYSVTRGGGKWNLKKMLQTALKENPGKKIFLKIHPDNISNNTSHGGFYGDILHDSNVEIIDYECNSIALMKHVEKVYVFSSQLGFEAVLLGKNVQVFGLPFYCGWGFTNDRHPHARNGRFVESRKNKRSKEEVFYVAYCLYTRYLDKDRNVTTIDEAIDILINERNQYFIENNIIDELGIIQ